MEANTFIDESFKTLRSAEGAFDMLHNFKHIRSRDAINSTMMKKFNEILTQFEKEVRTLMLCPYVYNRYCVSTENVCVCACVHLSLWYVYCMHVIVCVTLCMHVVCTCACTTLNL